MKKYLRTALTLGAILCLLLCGLVFTACRKEHVHKFEIWESDIPSTCTTGGREKSVCSLCDAVEYRNTDPLGHEWGDSVVITAPKCEEEGLSRKICVREGCGTPMDEIIPPLEHKWTERTVLQDATCTQDGVYALKCSLCGSTEGRETIPALGHEPTNVRVNREPTCEESGESTAFCSRCREEYTFSTLSLGHDWKIGRQITAATCEEGGVRERVCQRVGCGIKENFTTEPLGHQWETKFTVDKEPTMTEAGSRSRHCTRCEKRTDEQAILPLDSNAQIEYELRLVRTTGELLTLTGVAYTVKDGAGETVAFGSFQSGVAKVSLRPAEYTVTVGEGLPSCYGAQESYTMQPEQSKFGITLTSTVMSSPAGITKYRVGDLMHDFAFTTIDGQEKSLSQLLQEKKLVMLNFWATWCGPCESEFPAMIRAYNDYSDDVAIVAIDPDFNQDTEDGVVQRYVASHGLPFYVVHGNTSLFTDNFNGRAIPVTVIIDSQGVIRYMDDSAQDEETFRSLFAKYTSAPYYTEAVSATALPLSEPRALEAILPQDRKD